MGGLMSRNKGKRAERAVVNMLNDVLVSLMTKETNDERRAVMSRNLEQVRKGGCDVIGLDWASIEVKHQKVLALPSWWAQTMRQCRVGQQPILVYKTNGAKWRVRMMGRAGSQGTRESVIDISIYDFLDWFADEVQRQDGAVEIIDRPAIQTAQKLARRMGAEFIERTVDALALSPTPVKRYPGPWEK